MPFKSGTNVNQVDYIRQPDLLKLTVFNFYLTKVSRLDILMTIKFYECVNYTLRYSQNPFIFKAK